MAQRTRSEDQVELIKLNLCSHSLFRDVQNVLIYGRNPQNDVFCMKVVTSINQRAMKSASPDGPNTLEEQEGPLELESVCMRCFNNVSR